MVKPSEIPLRWIVPVVSLAVCASLATLLVHHAAAHAEVIFSLCLLVVATTTAAWIVCPPAGSVSLSLLGFVELVWAWASQQTAWGVWALAAFGLLSGVASSERWRRQHRLLRLQQALEDLAEERTVKGQAVASEQQTREALQKKLSRYTRLQTIAEELSGLTDLSPIAQLAVDRAFSLIGKSDVCLLFLLDQEHQQLSLVTSKKREPMVTVRTKHGDQFDRYVLRTHRPLLVNDIRSDFRFTVALTPDRSISSVIACPLLLGQSPSGVLRLDSTRPAAYTQDDLRFLDILLDLVAAATANAKLFARTQQLAMTDSLTGLTLRRPFLEQLSRELIRSTRSREPASVLMLDVDHFKDYNDTFGHTAGDLVLRGVAEMLRAVVPPGGSVARYGGEEFVVLLPRHARAEAKDVAEKIRRLIEQQVHAGTRKPERTVTVSVGIAAFPDDAQKELELLRMADQRLYQAKHDGRNRVCAS